MNSKPKLNKGLMSLILIIFLFLSCQQAGNYISVSVSNPAVKKYSISGLVKDQSGDSIKFAEILLKGFINRTTITDNNGNFKFDNIPYGKYNITIFDSNHLFFPQSGVNDFLLDSDLTSCNFIAKSLKDIYNGFQGDIKLINQIQGDNHVSPYKDMMVNNVVGIITVTKKETYNYNKYQEIWIQNPFPDNNIKTSEGIKVITGQDIVFDTGDLIFIKKGLVEESRQNIPEGSIYKENLSRTQILCNINDILLLEKNNTLPSPVILGEGDYIEPNKYFKTGCYNREADNINSLFDPEINGLDFFECIEGMVVEIREGLCVGGNDENNEIPVISQGGKNSTNRSIRGGLILAEDYSDFNPEVLTISDYIVKYKDYKTGDKFLGAIRGVVDYSYERYKIYNIESLPEVESTIKKEYSQIAKNANKLTVCSYNIENFSPLNTPNGDSVKINGIADDIVNRLFCPDIIGFVEVQDNSGNMDLGDVSCDKTLDELISSIEKISTNTASYKYRYINPIYNTEGGEPFGNIRVVFMYNDNRVKFIDKPTADEIIKDRLLINSLSFKGVELNNKNGSIDLSYNPGRIDPLNPIFDATRKSLIGEFVFNGEKIFIILNHLIAKGGDEGFGARFHPPLFGSEEKRDKQSRVIHDFVKEMLNIDPQANIIVMGDFNDFHFSKPLKTFEGSILTNLIETLPVNDRYSYLYQGNSQILDNVLISKGLLNKNPEIDIVHCNSEYSYNLNYTDHDPVLSAFSFSNLDSDNIEPDFCPDFPLINGDKCYEFPLKVKTTKTGRVYYAGFSANSYVPNNKEILSGLYKNNTTIFVSGIITVLGEREIYSSIQNLKPDVEYDLFFIAEDNSMNRSTFYKKINYKTRSLEEREYAADLFISEYVEGSSYNKVIEIFNYTGNEIDLSKYSIRRDGNSDGDFDDVENDKSDKELNLRGTLKNNKTFVIRYKRDDLDLFIKSIADMSDDVATGAIAFGGDDPIALYKDGIEIDRIGIHGGIKFGTDKTFVRKTFIRKGKTGCQDPRTNGEWEQYEKDTYYFLGGHVYDP